MFVANAEFVGTGLAVETMTGAAGLFGEVYLREAPDCKRSWIPPVA